MTLRSTATTLTPPLKPLWRYKMSKVWKPEKYQTFDVETSGVKPEYSLQPWRVPQGKAWLTSFVSLKVSADDKRTYSGGVLDDEDNPHD